MTWTNPNFITALDLGIAYRKAKADLYYERDQPVGLALCEYEMHLEANLSALLEKLRSGELGWMTEPEFVGDWSVIPKDLDCEAETKEPVAWRPSDPDECWHARTRARRKRPVANFRLVGAHSMDFHVTSTLWMLKVGHLYDAALDSAAFGSRLRRYRSRRYGRPGELNRNALGSFQPYFGPFGSWRDRGLTVMRRAIEEGKRVVAVTADVRSFYHCTSPDFLVNPAYLKALGMAELTPDEERFSRAFIDALHAWAAQTPIHHSDPRVGLPVGLPASRLVANVALAELDRVITRGLAPLYYGRYVDDILLVLQDKEGFTDGAEVWRYIRRRVGSALRVKKSRGKLEVHFVRPYLGASQIVLAGDKQKVFLLEGSAGLDLVGSIERQVRSRASEWRALPDLPDTPMGLAADVVAASGDDGEEVDNLRKAEALATRRAALAIRLRNIEAFDHDLPPDQWREQRGAFLQVTRRHLLALPQLFDFAPYVRRLFALAMACRDYAEAHRLLARISEQIDRLGNDCAIRVAAGPDRNIDGILDRWRDHLGQALAEGLVSALTHTHLGDTLELEETLKRLRALVRRRRLPLETATTAIVWAQRFFVHDLARMPYRLRYFHYGDQRAWTPEDIAQYDIPAPVESRFNDGHHVARILEFLRALHGTGDMAVPMALLYPTRPFSVPELYFLVPGLLEAGEKRKIGDWTLAFRGFSPRDPVPGADKDGDPIVVPRDAVRGTVHVAVTSWNTTNPSWEAALTSTPDPDRGRYARLNRMLNDVLRTRTRVD